MPFALLAVAVTYGASGMIQARATDDPYIVAAGDIACDASDPGGGTHLVDASHCGSTYTAQLFAPGGALNGTKLKGVVTLGDTQYNDGTYAAYTYQGTGPACISGTAPSAMGASGDCSFDGSWGAATVDAAATNSGLQVWPNAGGHDWNDVSGVPGYNATNDSDCSMDRQPGISESACGYENYFGQSKVDPLNGQTSNTYGSYTKIFSPTSAHPLAMIVIGSGACSSGNSICSSPANGGPRSANAPFNYLENQLQNLPAADCVIVNSYKPRWSQYDHGNLSFLDDLWKAMFPTSAGGLNGTLPLSNQPDLVMGGHDHVYERFDTLDASGNLGSSGGVTQIISGMGGDDTTTFQVGTSPTDVFHDNSGNPAHFGEMKISYTPGSTTPTISTSFNWINPAASPPVTTMQTEDDTSSSPISCHI